MYSNTKASLPTTAAYACEKQMGREALPDSSGATSLKTPDPFISLSTVGWNGLLCGPMLLELIPDPVLDKLLVMVVVQLSSM